MNKQHNFFTMIDGMRVNNTMLIVFFYLTASSLFSQSTVTSQIWADMAVYNEYSQQVDFYGDFGHRIKFSDSLVWNRLYIRPAIKYSPFPWLGIRGGVGLFYTKFPSAIDQLELRPFQGISVGWPKLPRMKFSHYFRLEERIFYETENWERSVRLRFRYQLSGRFKPNISKQKNYVYFPAFIEAFANEKNVDTEQNIFANELRVSTGVGFTWSKYWSAQFVVIFQKSRNEEADFKTSDMIFRLSLRNELVPLKDTERLGN